MQVKGNNDDLRQLNVVRGWYEPSLLSFLYIYLFLRLHFIVMVWDMLLDECLIAMFSHEYFQYPGGALYVICYLHALFYSYSGIVVWYPPLNTFTWFDLAHAYTCLWLKQKVKPRRFIVTQSICITFMPLLIYFCRKYDYDGYALLLSLPSLLLAFTCTKRECCLCIQNPENQVIPKSPL